MEAFVCGPGPRAHLPEMFQRSSSQIVSVGPESAVLRFGLGARPGELKQAAGDPLGWLKSQIVETGADQPSGALPPSDKVLSDLDELQRDEARDPKRPGELSADAYAGRVANAEIFARAALGVQTSAGFRERWALFWANHFSITAQDAGTLALAGPFEREAIRPNVFKRFEDLAVAALKHPAMLIYYDQAQSAGPSSVAVKAHGGGASENLGRELMELHTVGTGAGYTQADVHEMALALTGWSVGVFPEPQAYRFVFRPDNHEPGPRRVMGRAFDGAPAQQAETIVRDLCRRSATAHRLALKIARHFVSDNPPAALVERLRQAYLQSDGSLAAVATALVEAPESWSASAGKFKTPQDFYLSVRRALAQPPPKQEEPYQTCNFLEQPIYSAPSPAGWPDAAEAWASPSGLAKRAAWLLGTTSRVPSDRELIAIADDALGARLRPETLRAIRASSADSPLPLLFLSPEFLRR
jgi:uncharacterized protein (DUF1800 family)